jgi:hypothetical protein
MTDPIQHDPLRGDAGSGWMASLAEASEPAPFTEADFDRRSRQLFREAHGSIGLHLASDGGEDSNGLLIRLKPSRSGALLILFHICDVAAGE